MPFERINGLNVYYESHGRGEVIVLLHNGFSCTKMWDEIYPALVSAGYRVVSFDRRGYGRSEPGADFENFYTGDGFREENVRAMALLMEKLKFRRFHIVGQCEGGVVGVDYAVQFPGQVMTLTTASTMCFSRTPLVDFNREKFPPTFNDLTPEIRRKYADWHGPDRAEYFYTLCSRYGGEYGRAYFDLRDNLKEVACPALVMYPDRGHFFEVEQGVAFYRSLPRGELAVFPRCGHNIHEHYPTAYVRQVLNFIAKK
ncbi:MAG: alpha/beta hydrolase [Desulfobacteraceae bacterium]|nr:alpha/beta hydrolase [Desulfobacteraceae bacterium]